MPLILSNPFSSNNSNSNNNNFHTSNSNNITGTGFFTLQASVARPLMFEFQPNQVVGITMVPGVALVGVVVVVAPIMVVLAVEGHEEQRKVERSKRERERTVRDKKKIYVWCANWYVLTQSERHKHTETERERECVCERERY